MAHNSITEASVPIVIFGGSYDPIHYGHLRMAEYFHNLLPQSQISLMPNALPPHKEALFANTKQRKTMLKLAIGCSDYLNLDERELQREGPSYTLTSLLELRAENPQTPLILVIGSDSLASIESWHQWQRLPELAHICVLKRPRFASAIPEALAPLIHKVEEIAELSLRLSGCFMWISAPLMDISSSQIRESVNRGDSVRFLLPDSVIEYINEQGLYRKV